MQQINAVVSGSKAGRREYILAESENGGVKYQDKHLADARRIQNVIFGSTREGDPEYGVNISSYLMEISETAKEELEDAIRKAIAKYCPDVRVDAMKIQITQAARGRSDGAGKSSGSIIIGVGLNYQGVEFPFALVGEPHPNGTLVSSLRV